MAGDKWVYDFAEGSKDMRDLLGGKGANVAEMTRVLGADRVPAGFTITTEACVAYMKAGQEEPDGMAEQVKDALERLQEHTGKLLGDDEDPLLVSVRSGARESMPGMLDTVLNLGLNDTSVEGLAKSTENDRFAWDSYRRFVQMFGNVSRGIDGELFEKAISNVKQDAGVTEDTELDVDALKDLTERFKALYKDETGDEFPQDPKEQLRLAIRAVFDSWTGERAQAYRRINRIPDEWGTAVNVQQMVFGNKGDTSGSGVAFSRDEVTGAPEPSGDFLPNAQGEDVVSGARTPRDIREMKDWLPEAHAQLMEILSTLERHYEDMQDTEFTVEDGQLYMLQTRSAKRPAQAAVRFARDAVGEGLLSRDQALMTIDAEMLTALLVKTFDPNADYEVISKGVPAAPGGAKGKVVFTAKEAVDAAAEGEAVVLVRPDTNANDVAGFHAAKGILTSLGGKASHAALVARGMGVPCVTAASELKISLEERVIRVGDQRHDRRGHARRRPARRPHRGPGLRRDPEGVRDRARVGRRSPPPRCARERRHAEGRRQGARAGRRGHRPLPDGAHVHGRGPPAEDAADDHGRRRGLAPRRARGPAAVAAGGLRGPLRVDEGAAGDDPAAGPAAARVSPGPSGPGGAGRARADRMHGRPGGAREAVGDDRAHLRGEPDARHPRLPARDPLSRDLRDAGQGDHARGTGDGGRAAPRDHDPARRLRARDRDHARAGGPDRRRGGIARDG
jgi:pyruvate,orthophosphate dikinase